MTISRSIILVLIIVMGSCLTAPEREVETLYLEDGSYEYKRSVALYNLYQHYIKSTRSRDFYEIVSKHNGRYILNYYPKGELLTLCVDPGSGWLHQYKVSEQLFEKLIKYNITLNELSGDSDKNYDSLLVVNEPFFNVKTNGNP